MALFWITSIFFSLELLWKNSGNRRNFQNQGQWRCSLWGSRRSAPKTEWLLPSHQYQWRRGILWLFSTRTFDWQLLEKSIGRYAIWYYYLLNQLLPFCEGEKHLEKIEISLVCNQIVQCHLMFVVLFFQSDAIMQALVHKERYTFLILLFAVYT